MFFAHAERERGVGSLNELASECSTETLYNKLLRHVRTFGLDHLFVFNVVICHSKLKMSECLRTYGPQIIRVPQLQIED